MFFMWTGNWYCGIITMIIVWVTFPTYLYRFHNGSAILIFKRVGMTVIRYSLVLVFFLCAIGCVLVLGFKKLSNASKFFQVVPETIAFITGDFALDDLLTTNEQIYGSREFFLAIVIFFLIVGGHVVVMNVFTGLAVGDVAEIQSTAQNHQSRSLMKFILYGMENMGLQQR